MLSCAALLSLVICQRTDAQSFVMHPSPESNSRVSLRFLRRSTDGLERTFLSGTYELLFDIVSKGNLNFQAAIPFSVVKYEGHNARTGLGNIYAGVARRLSQGGDVTSAILYGVYIPTLDSHSSVYTTHYQEPPTYLNQTISLAVSYRYHRFMAGGFIYGLDIGPDLALPKNGDPEVIIHYGLSGGFRLNALALLAEFYGIMWLDECRRDLGNEFWNHSISLGAGLKSGSFRPAIFYQMRLDEELGDGSNGVLGIQCEFIAN